MNTARAFLGVCLYGVASVATGHGGGLNAAGCHNGRGNGDYHCHRGPAAGSTHAPRNAFAPAQARVDRPSGSATGAYGNCAAARAAGAAPVRRGQAGYGGHLDRDGDGIGCE